MMTLFRILCSCLLISANPLHADNDKPFAEMNLNVHHDDEQVLLDGTITYSFSDTALEALENGLPLVVRTDIKVVRSSGWFWDTTLVSKSLSQQIQYAALSQQYLVKDIQTSLPKTFLTRDSAIDALGHVDDLSVVSVKAILPDNQYKIKIKTWLDIESLPSPLRPLAYISDKWRLESDWAQWPIK
ncbi:MAG: DUF4390 domain-containing protein [Gammaproteobacteria bacterium]|nr:MAG: DUF4390 domain-containing protein [Gammaproteobacteria bacterium]